MSGRERSLLPRLRLGGAAATFFMLGEHERARRGLAAEVAQAGHEVALHEDALRHLLARTRQDTRGDPVGEDALAPGAGRAFPSAVLGRSARTAPAG